MLRPQIFVAWTLQMPLYTWTIWMLVPSEQVCSFLNTLLATSGWLLGTSFLYLPRCVILGLSTVPKTKSTSVSLDIWPGYWFSSQPLGNFTFRLSTLRILRRVGLSGVLLNAIFSPSGEWASMCNQCFTRHNPDNGDLSSFGKKPAVTLFGIARIASHDRSMLPVLMRMGYRYIFRSVPPLSQPNSIYLHRLSRPSIWEASNPSDTKAQACLSRLLHWCTGSWGIIE